MHKPDGWQIIKFVTPKETLYKVMGSWSGGYLQGDSWRLNSGICGFREDKNYYYFKGYSGSEYKCHKYGGHFGIYAEQVCNAMITEINNQKPQKAALSVLTRKELGEYIKHLRIESENNS